MPCQRLKMCFSNERTISVNERPFANILETNNAYALLDIMRRFQVTSKRPIRKFDCDIT